MTAPDLPPPLKGVRVLEFAGLGPGPFCGQLLADLGAEVIVVDRPTRTPVSLEHAIERRGKRSIILDLKNPDGLGIARDLAARADLLIEGNRPGVMERLGLGPADCHARNPALVYGRMTGWGQTGPYALMAGHDINYLALTGALYAIGPADRPPPPPLNLLGDFGGGSLFLATGLLAGLTEARTTGRGRVVDAAICDGVSAMMGMIHSWHGAGRWQATREANILDGAAPYYRCYATSDGGYMAVGAIEPQFHAALLAGLGIDPASYGEQNDPARHAEQAETLARLFALETRAHWTQVFDGTDACVAPVLSYDEVAGHPHNAARAAIRNGAGLAHPATAPRFEGTAPTPPDRIPTDGADSHDILADLGIAPERAETLIASGAVGAA